MVPFWVPIIPGPDLGDPKRDHNFDIPPCRDNGKEAGNYYSEFRVEVSGLGYVGL